MCRLATAGSKLHHSTDADEEANGQRDMLYDQDFVLWTVQQAAALRRAKTSNLPLDWENLAEEIESLGRSGQAS